MTTRGKLLWGLLGLVIIWFLLLFFRWEPIEDRVGASVQSTLQSAGIGQVSVDLEDRGRDVLLSGVVRDPGDIDRLEALVLETEGVRVVDMAGIQVRPLEPSNLKFAAANGRYQISGLVRDVADSDRVARSFADGLNLEIDGNISTSPDADIPEWLESSDAMAAALSNVEQPTLELANGNLIVTGTTRTEADYEDALDQLGAIQGIGAVDADGLILKPYNPSWFELSTEGDSTVLSGQLAKRSNADRLAEISAQLAGNISDNRISLSDENAEADWISEIDTITPALQGVEDLGLQRRDGALRIAGVVRNQGALDRINAAVGSLPQGASLNTDSLELRPYQYPTLSLRKQEGVTGLSGQVGSEGEATAIADAIQSSQGQEEDADESGFDNQLSVSRDVSPDGWGQAVLNLAAGFSEVEQGELSIEQQQLRLAGTIRDEDAYSALIEAARSVENVDSVDVADLALRPFKSPRFAVTVGDDNVLASGLMGDDAYASKLTEAVDLVFEAGETTQIVVDPDVTQPAWIDSVIRLLPVMTELEDASLTANDNAINMSGIARTQQVYALVSNAAGQAEADFQLNNNVALRPWQPPTLDIDANDQRLAVVGMMPNQQVLENMDRQLAGLGNRTGLARETTMAVGEDIEDADWLTNVGALIPDLATLNNLGLRVVDGVATLRGTAPDQASADGIVDRVRAAIGSLQLNNLVDVAPAPEPDPEPVSSAALEDAANDSADSSAGDAQAAAVVYPDVAQEDMARCETNLDQQMADDTIEFEFASAALSAESNGLLNVLANAINLCPDVVIEVGGHTDNIGSQEANLDLSAARAQAVVDYFARVGISGDKVTARGYGSSVPIADNADEEGRAKNRRIEFNIKTTR